MSTETKFVPVFQENTETRGIIATNQMDLNVEMPNEYKIWLKTPKTNISSTGVTFQATNTNKFIDSNMRLDLTITVTLTGHTYAPNPTGPVGTPPYLWSSNSCGVEPFAVNKLINRLGFNIQNKQWVEEQRTPELIDVLASQFDLEKLSAHGIYPFEDQGAYKLGDVYGRGVVSRDNLRDMGIQYHQIGATNALAPVPGQENNMQKQFLKGYVTVDSVGFSRTGSDLIGEPLPQFGYATVPMDGSSVFYTNGSGAMLTQTVVFTVHEYIISPSLANPYTRNPFSKSYYVGSYPLNLTCNFDTSFFDYFCRNLVASVEQSSTIITPTVTTAITDANLYFYTFDTTKNLAANPYQRTLYYNFDTQTMGLVTVNSGNYLVTKTSSVTTSNLSSLPPYIMGWVSLRSADNTGIVTNMLAPNTNASVPSYMFNQLQNVSIQYGSQTDCMLGTDLTWREICDLTETVIQNPKLRNMIMGNWANKRGYSVFDHSVAGDDFANITGSVPENVDDFWLRSEIRNGMSFFILPTAKLNWRPILRANTATIPEFNYGSNNFKALKITMNWYLPTTIANIVGSSLDLQCQPVVILLTKRVRSVPMDGQGPLFDEKVEYDLVNNNAFLSDVLEQFYSRNMSATQVNNELQYVGGGFFGDILSKVKNALPIISSVFRGVREATRGHDSGLLGHVNRVSNFASQGADMANRFVHEIERSPSASRRSIARPVKKFRR